MIELTISLGFLFTFLANPVAPISVEMSTFKASGKYSRLCDVYSKMDHDFKNAVDLIIDNHEPGFSLLRLLRLDINNIQTPGRLLQALVDRYDLDKHYFIINDNVLNITLEDVLYITGLPIDGKAVISETSRDKDAFTRAFGILPECKVYTRTLECVALDQSRPKEQRLQALLLLVIVCFVSPVCEDYVVHGHLVQFVTDLAKVDSYSWGAAFLASLYVGLEKYKSKSIKKSTVDGNCWPLLVRHILLL